MIKLDIIKYLINSNSDINLVNEDTKETPLHNVCGRNCLSYEMIKYIYQKNKENSKNTQN